jgi:glycosyltransferase involved in cell wall biosynthesis
MFEIVNQSIPVGGGFGTLFPELDLEHAPSERLFARTLDEFRPDVVHVHELMGLPSSLIDVAQGRGVAVVMTLHDYLPLCPVLKLFDRNHDICLRHRPGAMCAVCSQDAPAIQLGVVADTTFYEQTRVIDAVPGLKYVPRPRRVVRFLRGLGGWAQEASWRAGEKPASAPAGPQGPGPAPPAEYQRRRDVNVARLSRADRLLAVSSRVEEIYRFLGVEGERLRTLHITQRHIAEIRPRRLDRVERPVRFATLTGCSSVQKGTGVIMDALEALHRQGFTERDFTLTIKGYVETWAEERLPRYPAASAEGVYGPEEMDGLLDRWHVGIVPSVWEEAYGFVGPEFLAKGLPVIGNRVGGITDYTRDGETGWVNRSLDGEGLAAIMADVIRRPEQIPALNERILARRSELVKSLPEHAAEIDAIYADVVRERGRVPAGVP